MHCRICKKTEEVEDATGKVKQEAEQAKHETEQNKLQAKDWCWDSKQDAEQALKETMQYAQKNAEQSKVDESK